MRVAVGIRGADIDRVIDTYNLMSKRHFTHTSPTLFNAGTPHPQLSICFPVCMKEDSIGEICDTLKNCAMIGKTAGGTGLNIHRIRATGYVNSTSSTGALIFQCHCTVLHRPMDTRMVSSQCFVHVA